ncbi:MAG: HPP family protein [Alphaproteobacteria bacterium]
MNILELIRRHQPGLPCVCWIKSGIGAMIGMGFVGWLGHVTGEPFLIAPFGASCVLLFAVPSSPLSQPANVIGGHMLATMVALSMRAFLPPEWWAVAIVVGLVIGLMVAFRLTHPPAGATPVVVMLSDPGPMFLLFPMLTGSIALVLIAYAVHKMPPHAVVAEVVEREGENV